MLNLNIGIRSKASINTKEKKRDAAKPVLDIINDHERRRENWNIYELLAIIYRANTKLKNLIN